MIADVAGYYGILACCVLGDGAGDGGAAGTHKGIFGWKVQHDAADSVAQSGKEPLPPRLPTPVTLPTPMFPPWEGRHRLIASRSNV